MLRNVKHIVLKQRRKHNNNNNNNNKDNKDNKDNQHLINNNNNNNNKDNQHLINNNNNNNIHHNEYADWTLLFPSELVHNKTQVLYCGHSLSDLLRFFRNKSVHYYDNNNVNNNNLINNNKKMVNNNNILHQVIPEPPYKYMYYFDCLFPTLVFDVWRCVKEYIL